MMLGRGAQHKSSLCFGDAGECVWFTARPEAMGRNQALMNLLQHIAREKRATPAQVALAWLLAQRRGSYRSRALPSYNDSENIAAADLSSPTQTSPRLNRPRHTSMSWDRHRPTPIYEVRWIARKKHDRSCGRHRARAD
jgi:aryl-alcohol dehydrogenase-like predicted oxidoreductase